MSQSQQSNLEAYAKNQLRLQRRNTIYFSVFVIGLVSSFFYLLKQDPHIDTRTDTTQHTLSMEKYASLGDITEFLKSKRALEDEIQSEMESQKRPKIASMNFATYLFPHFQTNENLEKIAAIDLWISEQKTIETNPKSSLGSHAFEKMRDNIINFEVFDKTAPRLSTEAEQVIRIYGLLANP